jgi:hypothetical protein
MITMTASRLSLAVLVAALASACAPAKPPTVSLRMAGNVKDALVTVDDQLLGTVAYVEKRGIALRPGKHRLTVEKPGFFPFDELVDAKDVPLKIQVQLEQVPD